MTRVTSIILALLMLCVAIVSCDSETPKSTAPTGTSDATAEQTGSLTTEEVKVVPDISEELRFDGEEFVIISPGSNFLENMGRDFFVSEEAQGELINDKALERINAIEDRFGITIVHNHSTAPQNTLNTAIASGTFVCDIAFTQITSAAPLAQKGQFLDFQTIDHIDLEKPWWDKAIIRDLAFGGKVYFMTGDISIHDEETTVCIFINKTLAEEKDLPNLYDNLENNTWTIDTLHQYVKGASDDLNGDGTLDTKDLWGMGSDSGSAFLFLNSCGASMAELDAEGKPVITINSTRAVTAIEKIIELYNDKESVIWASNTPNGWSDVNGMVVDGKICLIPANIYKFSTYLKMEDDFGVLPIPKLDSEQESYYHQVFTSSCAALVIPNNVENVEKVGAVTEYLAYLGREIMVPAYYDTYLDGRVKRDVETEKSFDIIFSTKRFDLGEAYNWGGISGIIKDAILQNGNITSLIEAKIGTAQQQANDTYEGFLAAFD
ncbi:MAG: carbohydrate ABC transporter substrate-binding protein [Ruminococcaceae bacterium]|nr:carbohydrate ABC transporter substrate-binding protein [Oscillospiraceae bacterium]